MVAGEYRFAFGEMLRMMVLIHWEWRERLRHVRAAQVGISGY